MNQTAIMVKPKVTNSRCIPLHKYNNFYTNRTNPQINKVALQIDMH